MYPKTGSTNFDLSKGDVSEKEKCATHILPTLRTHQPPCPALAVTTTAILSDLSVPKRDI